ncbi:hypothetical protein DYB36_013246 [Aphanomyces astaci]|uniref:Uncharacterized protein n=1 Tax=Aphanomyces astaci TaxID=112090 RepID=A0A397B5X4_APHAT|nr:hypothetical protein DYB36_013246 [Aphanomyces astaci]
MVPYSAIPAPGSAKRRLWVLKTLVRRGAAFTMEKDYAKAEQDYMDALSLDPPNAQLADDLANVRSLAKMAVEDQAKAAARRRARTSAPKMPKKTQLFALAEHQVLASHHKDRERPRTSCLAWGVAFQVEEDEEVLPPTGSNYGPRMDKLVWLDCALRASHAFSTPNMPRHHPRRKLKGRFRTPAAAPTTARVVQRQPQQTAADKPPRPTPTPRHSPSHSSKRLSPWTNQSPALLSLKLVFWTSHVPVAWLECPTAIVDIPHDSTKPRRTMRLHRGDVLTAVNNVRVVPFVDIQAAVAGPPQGDDHRPHRRRLPQVLQFTSSHLQSYTVRWCDGESLGVAFRRVRVGSKSHGDQSTVLTVVSVMLSTVSNPLAGRKHIHEGDILIAINGMDAVHAGFRQTQADLARLPRPLLLTFRGPKPDDRNETMADCQCVVS